MNGGLFGSNVLDVAIGLAFVYLLLAIFCTSINEWVAGVMKTRGKMLRKGILGLLDGQAGTTKTGSSNTTLGFFQDFFKHPLISGMVRDPTKKNPATPSYLPARTFATVVLDLVTPQTQGVLSFADVTKGLADLPDGEVKRTLLALVQNAGTDLSTTQERIEAWYNDAMDRVNGWYKRRTQLWTIAIALLITVAVNADTLHIARRLWTDPALRAKAVADAKTPPPAAAIAGQAQKPAQKTASDAALSASDQALLGQVLGWQPDSLRGERPLDWFERIVGWSLSVVAISLGAPFWFDTLNRFMNLRNAGRSPDETAKKPEKKKQPPADQAA